MKNAVKLTAMLFLTTSAWGQRDGLTALDALNQISTEFGPGSVAWVAEIRGKEGIPQPTKWEVMSFDKKEARLLAWFSASDRGRVEFEGRERDAYPDDPPSGYVSLDKIKLDSRAAFRLAETEAKSARIGFDSVNYVLKVREFSREPVWRIDLIDAENFPVGKIFLSAENGEILRTIWFYTGERGRPDGRALIIDSAAPNENAPTTRAESEPPSVTELLPDDPPGKLPIPKDEPAAIRRNPAPPIENEPDPAAALRDLRKKPTGNEVDTRIPPPPVPGRN